MRRVSFELDVGLKGDALLSELRGKVLGESRQEVDVVLKHNPAHPYLPVPDHEIVASDPIRELAVMVKRTIMMDNWDQPTVQNQYFLCGISDEGLYFLHSISGYTGPPSIEMIEEWADMRDWGFSRRIQGDVLIQFMPTSFIEQRLDSGVGRISVRIGDKNYGLDMRSPQNQRSITLGNHLLSLEGTATEIMIGGNMPPLVFAKGTNLILQHPEHGMVQERIPEGHWAVLAGQRGRTFYISGDRITGFD